LTLQRILREPLLYFAGIALLIFIVDYALSNQRVPKIIISQADIKMLSSRWEKAYFREPSSLELDTLIQQRIKEEVFAAHAIKMGLDQNDSNIRFWLYQKILFLSDSLIEQASTNRNTLIEYFNDNQEKYIQAKRYDISLGKLSETEWDYAESKPSIILKDLTFTSAEEQGLLAISGFNQSLNNITLIELKQRLPEHWIRPLEGILSPSWLPVIIEPDSRFVIYVSNIYAQTMPQFEEVSSKVLLDFTRGKAKQNEALLFEKLKHNYNIDIQDVN
jgi:hypothetical protein